MCIYTQYSTFSLVGPTNLIVIVTYCARLRLAVKNMQGNGECVDDGSSTGSYSQSTVVAVSAARG